MRQLFLFCLLFSSTLFAQQIDQTYRNPVIAGDSPDPTVIRIENDYYAAGTSNDFAPNYPLYHSKDLINWSRIGSVFNNPPEWLAGSFWAPELFYNNGTFFVYYTARRKRDNVSCIGVATTNDLTKGFIDRGLIIEWGNEAIDAFVFRDTDNKLYISWKAYGLDRNRPIELLMSELSEDGLSLIGDPFSLTQHDKGWIGRGDEGQCIIKRNEYYYLFYSIGGCCDNQCTYSIKVARAKTLRGPWEQQETTSLLEGGEDWKCSGHGTIVQTPDKRYFYLYHAYNAHDFEFIGRQDLLDELLWDDVSGWPYMKLGNTPSSQASMPFKNTKQIRNPLFYDDFSNFDEKNEWQWDIKLGKPMLLKIDKGVKIASEDSSNISFIGISPQTGNYSMETAVLNKTSHFKGLSIYGDKYNFVAWGIAGSNVQLFQYKEGVKTVLKTLSIKADSLPLHLKIESLTGRLFRFYWSYDQKKWEALLPKTEHFDGTFIPRWGAALRSGLMISGENENTGEFSYFRLLNEY